LTKAPFIPRPARLSIRVDSVDTFTLKLENSQARTLTRTLKAARVELELSDRDLADLLIAAVLLEASCLQYEK
jgi:hypothetical protein